MHNALGQPFRTVWTRPSPSRARRRRVSPGRFFRENPNPELKKPARRALYGPEPPQAAYQRIAFDPLYKIVLNAIKVYV